MTTKIRIDFEHVQQAADSLIAKGEKPTVNGIRAVLGKGSNSTILQHLQAWREAQPVQQKKAIVLPDSIIRSIHVEIEKAEAAGRSAVEVMLVEMREQVQGLLDEIADNEKHAEQVEAQLVLATTERDSALSASIAHEATIAAMRSQAEQVALEQAKKAIEQAKLLDEAKREADNLRVELAKSQIKSEKASAAEKALSKEKEATSELKAALASVRATLEAQQSELVMLRTLAQANATRRARVEAARSRT
jgi:isoleucyl-tRNA synthetase